MNKALITGGAGFIGFHLAEHLIEMNYQVDILDNFSRGVKDADLERLSNVPQMKVIHGDLLKTDVWNDLRKDYDFIFHFGAIIGVANVVKKPYEVLRDNVKMTIHMIEFAKKQTTLKRFVFASTSEVYAGTLNYFSLPIPTPEETPLAVTALAQPRTSYMLSKIYGEALCHQSGIPYAVIRPHNFYGPRMGMSHVIPELLKKAHEAAPNSDLEVYSAEHRRTFCYIEDAVRMIRLTAESPNCANETFNIGAQAPEISMAELAQKITQAVSKELSLKSLPAAEGSPVRRCPDMQKTIRATGYSAKTDLDTGIRKTYEWYRKNVFDRQGICAI